MSGNNYIALLFLLFGLAFCANNKSISSSNNKHETLSETASNNFITEEKKAVETKTAIENSNKKNEPKEYRITLLLPLFLDTVGEKVDTGKASDIFKGAVLGVDLYQGIKLAIDSLAKTTGNTFLLNIVDTKQSDELIKNIINTPAFYDADLIIGPVYNAQLKIASEQAKKYNIPLISPLSPAENLTQNNQRFFMCNPGIKVHLKTLFDYALQNYANDNVMMIRQTADKDAAAYINNLSANSKLKLKDYIFSYGKYTDAATKESIELRSKLKSNTNNVLIVPSTDLQLAHKISRELQAMANDYPIIVMGLPIWNPENDLRIDYLQQINTHFTLASYIDKSLLFEAPLAKTFFQLYKHYPNETNYKGFDIAYFFVDLLIQDGKDFYKDIDRMPAANTHTTFYFQPAYSQGSFNEETQMLYYENKYVHLFRYDETEGLKKLK